MAIVGSGGQLSFGVRATFAMSTVLKKVEAWPFTFGGEEHSGWLPPEAATPKPTRASESCLMLRLSRPTAVSC
jgi:hypothetical protein